jgi:hypothetical protein
MTPGDWIQAVLLFAGGMTPGDWVQGVLILSLVGVTFWYARQTRVLAEAGKAQAEASVKMAEEMRQQRLASVSPQMVVSLIGQKGDSSGGLPREISFKAVNHGPGVAWNLETTICHCTEQFMIEERSSLTPNSPWESNLAKGRSNRKSRLPSLVSQTWGLPNDCRKGILAVSCQDAYGNTHLTALYFALDNKGDVKEGRVERKRLEAAYDS